MTLGDDRACDGHHRINVLPQRCARANRLQEAPATGSSRLAIFMIRVVTAPSHVSQLLSSSRMPLAPIACRESRSPHSPFIAARHLRANSRREASLNGSSSCASIGIGFAVSPIWSATPRAVVGPTTGRAITAFMVIAGQDSWYAFAVTNGNLTFVAREQGKNLGSSLPLDPSEHRQWRFRHDQASNTLYWETRSPEGEWSVRHSSHPQGPLSAISLELAAGTSAGVGDPGVASFEDISVHLKH